MRKQRRHRVDLTAQKILKEPITVTFRTKSGEPVDLVARKRVKEQVGVSFPTRNKKRK